ncbi:MAG: class I SAM-dependent methyltransferase [Candidatus Woesebacteria bacterium]|nr:MAG: class I SAM-dependent methyltransferase [Candidatus Woesebacteria bacterium]
MKIYEGYHKDRKPQTRIITRNDFTYHTILSYLSKYVNKKKEVLDIGCGVGAVDLYLGNLGVSVLGIDISKNGIAIAKENAKHLGVAHFVKFTIMDFPRRLPKKQFDLVICSEVLEHIVNDKSAVEKIFKLLKTGGVVIASSPSENAPLYRMGVLRKFEQKVGHLRRYSVKNFSRMFTASGFEILETKKTEGLLRNFLFTNFFGGFLLRILNKWPFSEIVTFLDDITVPIFGESNIYIVAKKK